MGVAAHEPRGPVLRADEQLLEEFLKAVGAWQRSAERLDERAAQSLGVHPTAGRCVEILYRSGALTAGDLAARLGISASGATPVLDRLEQAGMIQRVRPSRGDRRRIRIELTGRGRRMAEAFWDDLHDRLTRLAGEYSGSEVTLVRDFLRRACAIFEGHELKPAPDADGEAVVAQTGFANRETLRMAPSPRWPTPREPPVR